MSLIGTEFGRVVKASPGSVVIGDAIGDSVIVSGDRNILYKDGEIKDRNVNVFGDVKVPVISSSQAFERIGAAARLHIEQIKYNIEQARLESNRFFHLTLIYAGLGFGIVLIGVLLLFYGVTSAGIVTTIASLIPETTAALFFKKDKELRDVIESHNKHFQESQQILTMIDVAETMTDGSERDKMKQKIIYKVLGIEEA